MNQYHIVSVELEFTLFKCSLILHFQRFQPYRLHCSEWLDYVMEHDPRLAQFIGENPFNTHADLLLYLEELDFPFKEKLQEFLDFKRQEASEWVANFMASLGRPIR